MASESKDNLSDGTPNAATTSPAEADITALLRDLNIALNINIPTDDPLVPHTATGAHTHTHAISNPPLPGLRSESNSSGEQDGAAAGFHSPGQSGRTNDKHDVFATR
jgi:hypothetical protein